MKSVVVCLRRGRRFKQIACLLLGLVLFCGSVRTASCEEPMATFIGDYDNITVMELNGNFDALLPDGSRNTPPRQVLAREFYKTHKDDYDFLVFFTNFAYQLPSSTVQGFYTPVKNDTFGIGIEQFDLTNQFGSSGKLQGTIDMRNLAQNLDSTLDPEYVQTLNTLGQQMLQRWSAHVYFRDADGSESDALLVGKNGGYWSYLLDSDASLAFGADWRDNGDGTFTAVAVNKGFSALDLYLMGMVDKSEVPVLVLIDNPGTDPATVSRVGDTISGSPRFIGIDDIVAAMGERIPAAGEAPQSFKVAFVYVTRPATFSAADLGGLEQIRNGFLSRFSILTDGRGLVQVSPAAKADLPVNPGVKLPIREPRTLPSSLEEGVAWLRSHQDATGRWADSGQTGVRDTAEALAALGPFGADPGLNLGVQWLSATTPISNDYLARRLEALVRNGVAIDSAVPELLGRQNADGGWGSSSAYRSNPTDTALVLRALGRVGQSATAEANRAASYLVETQNADGGWGGEGAYSMVQPTAHALVALHPYINLPQVDLSLQRGSAFLSSKQNADGGFGNSPSTIYDSATALLALSEVGAAGSSARQAVTYLENYQFPDGGWYDSPFQTAAALQALWQATLDPDLTISADNIGLIPDKIDRIPCSTVVSVQVDNLGRTDTPQALVRLYEGAVDDEHLLAEQTAAIPGLQGTTLTFPLSLDEGRRYALIAVVDPLNEVVELDEGNNRAGKTLDVQETNDFVLDAQRLELSSAAVQQGERLTISAQIDNLGTVDAFGVPVRFYLLDGSREVEIAAPQADLPAGKTTTVTIDWYASIPGENLQVIASVDPQNLFEELDETNNLASQPVTIVANQLSNLVLTGEPRFSQAPALQDGEEKISVTLANRGNLAASNPVVSFYLGAPETGGELLGEVPIAQLAAGESLPVEFVWSPIEVNGEQLIVVRADAAGVITEVAEDDNQTLGHLTVLSRPDLVVAAADVEISPTAPRQGEAVSIKVKLYNRGEQEARDIRLGLQTDGGGFEQTVPLVSANGMISVSFNLTDGLSAGEHHLLVTADPADLQRELSEENNSADVVIGVQNADLWLSELYFSPNGDGVKDVTTLYYRFATPHAVQVAVRDSAGAEVRRLLATDAQPALDGHLTWDGRNARGDLVSDGRYRLILLDAAEAELGSLDVTLDTNRSSLFEALGSKFLLDESLLCDLPSDGQWDWLPREERLLFAIKNVAASNYETGIYAKERVSGEISRLVPDDWISTNPLNSYTYFEYFLATDQDRLAFSFNKLDLQTQTRTTELWLGDVHGGGLRKLREYTGSYAVGEVSFSPDGRHLLINVAQGVELVDLADLTGRYLNVTDGHFIWSPDGSRLLHAGSVLQVIELDGSVRDLLADYPDADWLNERQIVATTLNSSERDQYLWLVDADGVDDPLQVSDDYSHSLVLAPDGTHLAFVEGMSPYGGTKRVVVVDAAGSRTIVHETPYAEMDSGFNAYNTSYGMGIISNLLWSVDGGRLIFVDRRAERIDNSTFVPQLIEYAVNGEGRNPLPVFACTSFYTDSCDSAGTCWTGCEDVEPPLEMGRVKTLRAWSEDGRNLAVEGDENEYLFDLVSGEKRVLPLSTPLSFGSSLDEVLYSGDTCDGGRLAPWRLASLQNLTADLRPVRERSAVELYGTAADLNFAEYRLEYASAETPDQWLPIQPPVATPVLDSHLTPWVPPGPGSYLLRLTVLDKAGNTAYSRKRLNWMQTGEIGGFYRSSDIFSPNGDGVLDILKLSYRVREAVQFTAEVKNTAGEVVRSFYRSYSQSRDDAIVWDGRDETGQIVPDGHYSLTLRGFTFEVEVDATLPEVSISLGLSKLRGEASDINLTEMWIERRDVDSTDWAYEPISTCDQTAQISPGNKSICREKVLSDLQSGKDPITGDFLRFKDYRLVAKDRAGNVRILVAPRAAQVFNLSSWKSLSGGKASLPLNMLGSIPVVRTDGPKLFLLSGYTTINEDWADIRMQYWLGGNWYDAEDFSSETGVSDSASDPQAGSFLFVWNAAPVVDGTPFKVRLKATTVAGEARFSNEFVAFPGDSAGGGSEEAFYVEPNCEGALYGLVRLNEDLRELHHQVISQAVLDSLLNGRTFEEAVASEDWMSSLPEDAWEDYLVLSAPAEIPGNVQAVVDGIPYRYSPGFTVPLPETAGDYYLVRLLGVGESGTVYRGDHLPAYLPYDCPLTPNLYVLPQKECSFEPQSVTLFVSPINVPWAVIHSIEFTSNDGSADLPVVSWQAPLPKKNIQVGDREQWMWGPLEVDLDSLNPGINTIAARVNYTDLGDGQLKHAVGEVRIRVPDWTIPAPSASFVQPLDGSTVSCRDWRMQDGRWREMGIEGALQAAGEQTLEGYELCYSNGSGRWVSLDNPTNIDVPRKNIPAFDSPSVAGGQSYSGRLGLVNSGDYRTGGKLLILAHDSNGRSGGSIVELKQEDEPGPLLEDAYVPQVFSPNGDGVKDELPISYYLTRDAYVSLSISGLGGEIPLQDRQLQLAGDHQAVWDGRDSGAAYVADGFYEVHVRVEDLNSCSGTEDATLSVEVDATPPEVGILQPTAQAAYFTGNVVDILAAVNESHIEDYRLEVAAVIPGAAPGWQTLSGEIWRSLPQHWETSGLSGTWLIRASAEDRGGNVGRAEVSVDIVERRQLLQGLALTPDIISPNGDGRQDRLALAYQLLENAEVTFEIVDAANQVRNTEVRPAFDPGSFSWSWDGRDSGGQLLGDGGFRLRVTAAASATAGLSQTEELTFSVDQTAPQLDLTTPTADSYLAETTLTLAGAINDPHLADFSFEVASPDGSTYVDSNVENRPQYTFTLPESLAEGTHTISAVANDLAGNRSELNRTFTIDRTPPRVELLTPQNEAGFGIDAPQVQVTGTIDELNPADWQVRYGAGDDPQQWQVLTEQPLPADGTVTYEWTVGLPDGPADGRYTLSLLARDRAGQEGEARRQVLIDNHPPTAQIDQPAVEALLNAPFVISGSANDGNFKQALLELAPGICESATAWSPLRTFGIAQDSSTLFEFNELPADGDYCLRLIVTDLVGNQSVATRHFVLDTTPPAAPVLSGEVIERRDVQLGWTSAGDADLAGYHILRDAVQLAEQAADMTTLTDAGLDEGEFSYRVVAFDRAGNQSEPSNPFVAVVDRTPPLALISSPANGSRAGDLLDIRGSAYSEKDFGEYRLSYGFGAEPAAWTQLKRSPLAVSGGRLSQWDSWGLADGLYTLRLEAEDRSGNLAENRVQVEIDNTPPQPPVLNLPLVTRADVALSWPANPEPDIAGYLLLRNDRLVNASGVVIGSLTPYLLPGLGYADPGLVDGHYRYALIAVDSAGNQSLPSEEREIDIDTRAPKARILTPAVGSVFEQAIDVEAGAEDQDIASIQLQCRPAGTATWLELGPLLTSAPYKTTLNPENIGLSFGELELRAVAIDLGGRVDPDPVLSLVEYRDLTPPAAVQGLRATFDCQQVALEWNANGENDLAGYNIYRQYPNGFRERLNSQLLAATSFAQSFADDGDYAFTVTAVDQNGNEGEPSAAVTLSLKTPRWDETPLLTVDEQLALSGTNGYQDATVQLLKDGAAVADTTADQDGAFNFAANALARGDNNFSLVATDVNGNLGCTSETLTVRRTIQLPPPEGLQLDGVTGHDVQLSWQPVNDPEFDQFYVYRDGNRLRQPVQLIPSDQMMASASASLSTFYPPTQAVDGDFNSYWLSSYGSGAKWLEIDFARPYRVKQLDLRWVNSSWSGTDFEIQIWNGSDWQSISSVQGNGSDYGYFYYDSAFRTTKLRIYITGFNSAYGYAGLKEVRVYEKPVVDAPAYVDSVPQDGSYDYQISTVNIYGMEGPLSAVLPVGVGDTVPPEPPQNPAVSAVPEGRALQLTWEAGSTDSDSYNVYRSTDSGGPYSRVATTAADQLTLLDRGLIDGTRYFYAITANDQFGNESAWSTEVSAVSADSIVAAPSFSRPTRAGSSVVVAAPKADLAGFAEPRAQVRVLRDGVMVGEASARDVAAESTLSYDSNWFDIQLSPDRRYLAYVDDNAYNWALMLYDREKDVSILIVEDVSDFHWSQDGTRLVYRYRDSNSVKRIEVYDVATATSIPVIDGTWAWLGGFALSPDDEQVVFVSDYNGDDDLWLKDLRDGTLRQLTFGRYTDVPLFSPDGRYIAFEDENDIFCLFDLASGLVTPIYGQDYAWSFAWAPGNGSSKLAFSAYVGGWEQILVYDPATQTVETRTDTATEKGGFALAADGETLAYVEYDYQSYEATLWLQGRGWSDSVATSPDWIGNLLWLGDKLSYFFINEQGDEELRVLTPAGGFELTGVELSPGENPFYAMATDVAGNQSPSSEVMTLIYDTSLLPDIALAAEDINLFPVVPAPGQAVLANITLHNPTATDADSFTVDIYLWDSDGELRFLESQQVERLAANGEAHLALSFVTAQTPGAASLLAVVDPQDELPELVESNNVAIREFRVSATAGVSLSTSLSATRLSSHQPLDIALELLNNGGQLQVQRQVRVEDTAGNPVATLDQSADELPYGLSRARYSWETGTTFAGSYQVHSRVWDGAGDLLAEQIEPFTILPDLDLGLQITTDRGNYGPQQPVALAIELANRGENNILAELQLQTRILDSAGNEIHATQSSVKRLYPASGSRQTDEWNTALYPPGTYQVVVEVRQGDVALATATTNFVIDPLAQVRGSLTVEPADVVYGLDFAVAFNAANHGNQATTGVVRLALLDPQSLAVVATAQQDLALPVDGRSGGTFVLQSTNLKLRTYTAKLYYDDGSGSRLLAEAPFRVIDRTAPQLVIVSPQAAQTYRLNVELALSVSDDISGVDAVSYRLDGGGWQALPFIDLGRGRYGLTWHPRLSDNGGHRLEFRAVDQAGNSAQSAPLAFEVQMDVTPPVTVLEVGTPSYRDENDRLYLGGAALLTLTASDDLSGVAATEYRLDGGGWTPYLVPIALTSLADGSHRLEYRSSDAFGNQEVVKGQDFIIDNAAPQIRLTNLVDGGFYNVAMLPAYEVDALLPVDTQRQLSRDGVAVADGQPAAEEGLYRLTLAAVDPLGNQAALTLNFTIDLTPPASLTDYGTPAFIDATANLYLAATTSLSLTAQDPGTNAAGVVRVDYRFDNGSWSAYADGIDLSTLAEGTHLLSYYATDAAGNIESVQELPLILDNSAPLTNATLAGEQAVVGGSTIVSGNTQVILGAVDFYSGVATTEYRIDAGDWQAYVAPVGLTTSGELSIDYRSRDHLGHEEAIRSLDLQVDSQPPLTTLNADLPAFEEGGRLFVMPATQLTLTAADDLAGVAQTEYRIDGGDWHPYAPFNLAESGEHLLEFRSRDAVGNLEEIRTTQLVVDGEAPQLSLAAGEPQYAAADGTLYVAPQAPFTLTAEDAAAGADLVEYRVDGGSWADYAPFVLSVEGKHLIEARATDRLGNTTEIQTLQVTTDVTPPVTGVAFEGGSFIDGDRAVVFGAAQLVLSAADELSGVERVIYRFDGQGDWSVYREPVSLANLPPGEHLLQLQALDRVENAEVLQEVTFTRLLLDFKATQLTLPRVLVWLPSAETHCDDKEHGSSRAHGDDDGKRDQREAADIAASLIPEIFSGRDAYHKEVHDAKNFVRELRSGVYNVLLLLDADEPADAAVLGEIRAAVRRGTGLVAASWKQELHPQLRDLFGVVPRGEKKLAATGETSFLFAEPFGDVVPPTLVGRAQRVELAGGRLAAIIPAPEKCEGVRTLDLHLPLVLALGERVEVRLGRRKGHHQRLLEEESWTLSALPFGLIDQETGGVDGNLIITGIDASGIDLQLTSAAGKLRDDYTLELRVERSGRDYSSGEIRFSTACSAKLQPGVEIGPFHVTAVDLLSEKEGEDLPAIVVNHFAEGAAVLMNFDPLASAEAFGVEQQAALLGEALTWATPVQESARAGGILLLGNRLDLSGISGTVTAVESLGTGLGSPSFFGLPAAPFSRDFSLIDGDSAAYRYLVRFADLSGSFSKRTDLYYQTGFGPIPLLVQALSFEIGESSAELLQSALAQVDQLLAARPVGGYDNHEKERHEGDSRDDVLLSSTRLLRGVRQRLIHIGCLSWASRHDLEQVIKQTLAAVGQVEALGDPQPELLGELAEYLRIAEAAWFDAGSTGKDCRDRREHERRQKPE